MPTYSPRLNIPKPLGNETVSRAAFNTIYDTIDANAATRKEPEVLAQDIFASGFVVSGMVPSKNATVANQLDVTAGACYVQQPDGGLRRFTPAAASFTTSLASTTYYLDFQPDGTYSWGTAHSTQTGYLPIAEVTTDSAGNIATVADKRPLVPGIGKVNADLLRGRNLVAEHDAHLAEKASSTVLGHVKQGDGVNIDSNGVLSANVLSVAGKTGNVVLTKADVGLDQVDNMSATAIRTDTTKELRVEVVSAYPTGYQGRIIFHTGEGKFKGYTGSGWV
ncbi:hypothetical protein SAMN00808754_2031 [Thermanaeromonas toyohensis ToBE]|uniref:Uncharacterized protein n=1 Tax=Thermanaeromonas toyohensis ToBE TaxID=698762 RepID=A0A1W1VX36_9FIRM|nr:hypothetical protein [Thermanaeromonas toyohensis]SMB97927.1 hypothetical protein SAMN00808754_2031 [Thermanaeromonas toyohensis ToBE]